MPLVIRVFQMYRLLSFSHFHDFTGKGFRTSKTRKDFQGPVSSRSQKVPCHSCFWASRPQHSGGRKYFFNIHPQSPLLQPLPLLLVPSGISPSSLVTALLCLSTYVSPWFLLSQNRTQGAATSWEVQLLNGQKFGKTPLTSTLDLPW